MKAFETKATLDDSRHLTLLDPLPDFPAGECRVILLYSEEQRVETPWTPEFFESIHISDPAFDRPPQCIVCQADPLNE